MLLATFVLHIHGVCRGPCICEPQVADDEDLAFLPVHSTLATSMTTHLALRRLPPIHPSTWTSLLTASHRIPCPCSRRGISAASPCPAPRHSRGRQAPAPMFPLGREQQRRRLHTLTCERTKRSPRKTESRHTTTRCASRLLCAHLLVGSSHSRFDSLDRIDDIRARIRDATGIPVDQQRLIFAGEQLQGGHTLFDSTLR